MNTSSTIPRSITSSRFTLELEFVLSLSNPHYLQHLATVYPHLFIPATSSNASTASSKTDDIRFVAVLSYLYTYWSEPVYAKFLTHPGAVLNTLKLLQEKQLRRDVIRLDVVEALLRGSMKDDGEKGGVDVCVQEVEAGGEGVQQVDGERMDEGAG